MKHKLTIQSILLLLTAALPVVAADLAVSVQIDGHSRLVISTGAAGGPAQIYWDHLYGGIPSRFGGIYPIALNGYNWFPSWPNSPEGAPGYSTILEAAVKFSTNGITLSQEAGRTSVTIVQQPNAANAFTLIVDFDDTAPAGADQYHITLHGVSFSLVLRPAIYVSEVTVVWPTETNLTYQLQSSLTINSNWSNLGPQRQGTGTNITVADPVPLGSPRRFYRVIPIE